MLRRLKCIQESKKAIIYSIQWPFPEASSMVFVFEISFQGIELGADQTEEKQRI
jgi:hypothetical protein